jgi:hypothetical protein
MGGDLLAEGGMEAPIASRCWARTFKCKGLDLLHRSLSDCAIHLLAASLASGSMLARTRAKRASERTPVAGDGLWRAPGKPVLRILDGVDGPRLVGIKVPRRGRRSATRRESSLQEFIRGGVDLGNNYFQVHAVEREDFGTTTRKLSRQAMRKLFAKTRPCRAGMEACGSALLSQTKGPRELQALEHVLRHAPTV